MQRADELIRAAVQDLCHHVGRSEQAPSDSFPGNRGGEKLLFRLTVVLTQAPINLDKVGTQFMRGLKPRGEAGRCLGRDVQRIVQSLEARQERPHAHDHPPRFGGSGLRTGRPFEYLRETAEHVAGYGAMLVLPYFGEGAGTHTQALVGHVVTLLERSAELREHPGLFGLGKPYRKAVLLPGAIPCAVAGKVAYVERLVALRSRSHSRLGLIVVHIVHSCGLAGINRWRRRQECREKKRYHTVSCCLRFQLRMGNRKEITAAPIQKKLT